MTYHRLFRYSTGELVKHFDNAHLADNTPRFSVPHDRLFLDALERDLKREKAGQESTTSVKGEPGRSFQYVKAYLCNLPRLTDGYRYDPRRGLFEQFAGLNPGMAATLLVSCRLPR